MRHDLTNDELAELDDLLVRTPQPLQPLDAVMLDGYAAGVLVQPRLIPLDEWLPGVFDLDGAPLPAEADADWLTRVRTLAQRHIEALNGAIAEEGWFDPVLPHGGEGPEDAAQRDALRELPEYSGPVMPWVAGFQLALERFGGLNDNAEASLALARLYRHLPCDDDAQRAQAAKADQARPLKSLDDAIQDLVHAVTELWDLTQPQRYRVETVRRDMPKVGRNDPCPCGSGRKYKVCHAK